MISCSSSCRWFIWLEMPRMLQFHITILTAWIVCSLLLLRGKSIWRISWLETVGTLWLKINVIFFSILNNTTITSMTFCFLNSYFCQIRNKYVQIAFKKLNQIYLIFCYDFQYINLVLNIGLMKILSNLLSVTKNPVLVSAHNRNYLPFPSN